MSPVVAIDMDLRSPEGPLARPQVRARVDPVDCYGLDAAALAGRAGLVVPPTVDQEHLMTCRALVEGHLAGGGVVVFGGHLFRPWLPGARPFVPLTVTSHHDYEVDRVADHPVFAGVRAADLTFRRGVAGFFARGHHPPPPGATVLVRLRGGVPVTYVDRVTTPGTILVQATCDLLAFAGADTAAGRITGQLLDWIVAEAARRRPDR